jgi:hypothetical protein
MNALEIAQKVAQNPTVKAYARALDKMHRRMTYRYGKDFWIHTKDSTGVSSKGMTSWSDRDREIYNNLYNAAQTYRASIRTQLASA